MASAKSCYLLDTNILLWWLNDDERLGSKLRSVIENPKNQIYISVVSFWEISIKHKIGKLPLKINLARLIHKIVDKTPFTVINITVEHIIQLDKLPLIHNDPFDRILIAQALVEKLILVNNDREITKYKLPH